MDRRLLGGTSRTRGMPARTLHLIPREYDSSRLKSSVSNATDGTLHATNLASSTCGRHCCTGMDSEWMHEFEGARWIRHIDFPPHGLFQYSR